MFRIFAGHWGSVVVRKSHQHLKGPLSILGCKLFFLLLETLLKKVENFISVLKMAVNVNRKDNYRAYGLRCGCFTGEIFNSGVLICLVAAISRQKIRLYCTLAGR